MYIFSSLHLVSMAIKCQCLAYKNDIVAELNIPLQKKRHKGAF
ncbi:hypothetical protein PCIT_a0254 [Pseudoalteromonas citrea]|uniref:Uncharacterized protein n=1 Tax=Pseudoalteromonas citrea TaxID=43655 RepID=A0AAD4AKJ8_9GAMM|nr:hypothetical protein PCIT_a0254 [Pseudoalteromonas citrea]